MSEELTAEERAYALKRGVHMPEDVALFAKLVRLYDAALARAEAAERALRFASDEHGKADAECETLQSRLAEATALLGDANHHSLCEADHDDLELWRERYQAFLSATPAQAAEPGHNPEADAEHAKLVDVADKLRECRQALSETQANYGDLREHRNLLQNEADSAQARIAELEAALSAVGDKAVSDVLVLTDRIARAVAELEPIVKQLGSDAMDGVLAECLYVAARRALEALR